MCFFFQRSGKHLLSILCKSVWSGENRTLQWKMGSVLFEPLGWFKCCSSKLSFWLRGQKPQIKRNLWITIFNWKYQKWLERSYHLRIVIKSPKKIQQVKKVRKLPISLTDIFLRRGGFAENKNGVGKGKYLLRRKGEKVFFRFKLQVHKTVRWGWWHRSLAVLCQSSVEPSPATQTACSPGHCRWLDQACSLFGELQLVLLRTRLGPVDPKILTHREWPATQSFLFFLFVVRRRQWSYTLKGCMIDNNIWWEDGRHQAFWLGGFEEEGDGLSDGLHHERSRYTLKKIGITIKVFLPTNSP